MTFVSTVCSAIVPFRWTMNRKACQQATARRLHCSQGLSSLWMSHHVDAVELACNLHGTWNKRALARSLKPS
eukprot:4107474-Amphidinium_carterae.1